MIFMNKESSFGTFLFFYYLCDKNLKKKTFRLEHIISYYIFAHCVIPHCLISPSVVPDRHLAGR